MNNPGHWAITQLLPNLTITIHERTNPLCHLHEDKISAIWSEKLKQHPSLYNGRVFCVDTLSPQHIEGHWNNFKNILAQMTCPALFAENPLRPLAVVGLFHSSDGIIIGQRSAKSIYLPHYWQGIPAGNVETREDTTNIDLNEQIYAEALEELGLSPDTITIGPPLLACEHTDTHIIDIGIRIHSQLPFQTIQKYCQTHGNAEYDALKLLPFNHSATFNGATVPTLRALLEYV